MEPIDINEYVYPLPPDRIADFPLAERDQARLLHYHQGAISHRTFTDLAEVLPAGAHLVFNNTKVIPARLLFEKESGATIELLLLQPVEPSSVMAIAMETQAQAVWQCAIGNLKRWPENLTLKKQWAEGVLHARLADRVSGRVSLSWEPAHKPFAEVVQAVGATPLPPYIRRKAKNEDRERYQTVYARQDGAVAAPTAGLHFTDRVMQNLNDRQVPRHFVTLHVSAGTFQPVKAANAVEHAMHAEQVVIPKTTIEALRAARRVIAVGTTSMRTLESLYWYGVALLENPDAAFSISKLFCYESRLQTVTREQAIDAVLRAMEKQGWHELAGHTSIYIFPGYRFRLCDGLITNFHQPGSTLMLLVAAFIGSDWKNVYDAALGTGYRFLSYGDSSLLIPKEDQRMQ